MVRPTIFTAVIALPLAMTLQAQELSGYLVDGAGLAVRTGQGGCVRTGSWSASRPGIGCDAQPARVVLLPEPDGTVGKIVVRSAAGEKLLADAYAGAEVDGRAIALVREDAGSVKQRFGIALAARAPRPVSFTVNFASGSASSLTPESLPVIEALKSALAARPSPEIMVIGHTDRVGNAEANDALSKKRADAVRDILVAAGIEASRIETAGRGEREPLVQTADEVSEPRNRRVEINLR